AVLCEWPPAIAVRRTRQWLPGVRDCFVYLIQVDWVVFCCEPERAVEFLKEIGQPLASCDEFI
ncbi:MAG: hypothetical protein ACC652_10320, partial [Acidimicrobiales bacterium]